MALIMECLIVMALNIINSSGFVAYQKAKRLMSEALKRSGLFSYHNQASVS